MKEFSKYEEKILRRILIVYKDNEDFSLLSAIIDFEFSPNIYIDIKSEENCPVRISKTLRDKVLSRYGNEELVEILKQFDSKIFRILNLFQYLEQEKYLMFVGVSPISSLGTSFDANEISIGHKIEDKETVRLLYTMSKLNIRLTLPFRNYLIKRFEFIMEKEYPPQPVVDRPAHKLLKLTLIVTVVGTIIAVLLFISEWNLIPKHSGKESTDGKVRIDTSMDSNFNNKNSPIFNVQDRKIKNEMDSITDSEKNEIIEGAMKEFQY